MSGGMLASGRYAFAQRVQLSLGFEAAILPGLMLQVGIQPGVKVLLTPVDPIAPIYFAMAVESMLGVAFGGSGEGQVYGIFGVEGALPLSVFPTPNFEVYGTPRVGLEHQLVSNDGERPPDWGDYDWVTYYSEKWMTAGVTVGVRWYWIPASELSDMPVPTTPKGRHAIGVEVYYLETVDNVLDGAGGWRAGLGVSFSPFVSLD